MEEERMRKTLTIFAIAALAISGVALAGMATAPPESVTIDACMAKKSAVVFPHATHVGVTECATCHHTDEGITAESEMEVAACTSCHQAPEGEGIPDCAQMSMSKNPYHITCLGCHKEKVAADAASPAPTKCDGCHPKAE